MADVADIFKNPQLYKTLGQVAQSYGKGQTPGAQLGAFGAEEAENWAAREAREKAEKERKKKKQAGVFGDVAGMAAGIGTAALGQPWLAPAAASLASGGTSELAGGDADWGELALGAGAGYATMGLTKGLSSLGGTEGTTAATADAITATPEEAALAASKGGSVAGYAGTAGTIAGANAAEQPLADASKDGWWSRTKGALSNAVNSEAGQNALNYVDQTYGGPAGLATYLKTIGKRNEVPLSETLKPTAGLSEDRYRAMLESQVGIEDRAALRDYRSRTADIDEQRLGMQREQFEAKQNAPTERKRIDTQSGIEYTDLIAPNGAVIESYPSGSDRNLMKQPMSGIRGGKDIWNPASGTFEVGIPSEPPLMQGKVNSRTGEILNFDPQSGNWEEVRAGAEPSRNPPRVQYSPAPQERKVFIGGKPYFQTYRQLPGGGEEAVGDPVPVEDFYDAMRTENMPQEQHLSPASAQVQVRNQAQRVVDPWTNLDDTYKFVVKETDRQALQLAVPQIQSDLSNFYSTMGEVPTVQVRQLTDEELAQHQAEPGSQAVVYLLGGQVLEDTVESGDPLFLPPTPSYRYEQKRSSSGGTKSSNSTTSAAGTLRSMVGGN